VIVATLSYSLYLTHKSVFHVDKFIFGEENLQGGFGFEARRQSGIRSDRQILGNQSQT
jgi:peptidoglycan/LPS O-acetylase OafA/YrhL